MHQARTINQKNWLTACAIVLSVLGLSACQRPAEATRAATSQQPPAPPSLPPLPPMQMTERAKKDTAWDAQWPPLPSAGTPAQPIEQVRAMYAFAARHPEVLEYAPCYCGCECGGHKNARDCFVKGRAADGKPQWDGMGFM